MEKCTSLKDLMIALLIATPIIFIMVLFHNAAPIEYKKLNTENIEKVGKYEYDTIMIGDRTYVKTQSQYKASEYLLSKFK